MSMSSLLPTLPKLFINKQYVTYQSFIPFLRKQLIQVMRFIDISIFGTILDMTLIIRRAPLSYFDEGFSYLA